MKQRKSRSGSEKYWFLISTALFGLTGTMQSSLSLVSEREKSVCIFFNFHITKRGKEVLKNVHALQKNIVADHRP